MTLALLGLAVAATAVTAQQNVIEERKALMKASGQHTAALNRMVRGQEPFDPAKVEAAFAALADKARRLPALFPEGTGGGETRALPAIWEKRAAFEQQVAQYAKDVAEARPKATTLDGLKAVLPSVARHCGACHESFRRPAT
jgi:cytochrome c556